MTVAGAFTEADIEQIAGPRSYERGLEYLDSVTDLDISSTKVSAIVYGSYRYRVNLYVSDRGLGGDCTCPHGQEGFFCKHCVAVGLATLSLGDDLPRHVEARQAQELTLRKWLESLSKEQLLAEFIELIDEAPELRQRLELRAAAEHGDVATIRQAVRELIKPGYYIDYDQAFDYALDVGKAAAAIDSLIDGGGAAEAIGIAREAIDLLGVGYESVDDSSGSVGDSACELWAVHLRACQTAPPDPVSLADYLAGLVLHDGHPFEPDTDDYADLLGDAGADRLRHSAEAAYRADPTDRRARSLMESIVKAEGDVDALIAIYATDLDARGWAYLRIAHELDQAGRSGEALSWAERGLREAASADRQLTEYVAGRYAADGRTDDVLTLRRTRFKAERSLTHYQALRLAATHTGTWQAERDDALAMLQEDARNMPTASYSYWSWGGPVLVDALIDDGDLDTAWTAITSGTAKNATEAQRLRLSDASIATRPADALAIYLKSIEPLRSQTGDSTYRQMARLLQCIRACHDNLGTANEFARYLAAFRTDQKRKRNLMKILDENGM